MKDRVKSSGSVPSQWPLWTLCLLLLFSLVSSAHAQEIITLGQRNWDGSRAITHVLKQLIVNRLGYQTRIVESDDASIFTAMHKGKGDIDVLTDLWKLNRAKLWAKYVEGHKSVVVNNVPYMGQQGLFIPGYLQDQHHIHHVHDLIKPEIAKLFDSDGDGKGEYWPGAFGWNSTLIEQVKAKSYGYAEYFKAVIVSDRAFKAKLKTAYEKKQGILFYYWSPEWIHAAYDLRQLKEPPFKGFITNSQNEHSPPDANGCWHMIMPGESADWLEKSHVSCAWPDTEVHVAFSASLRKRAPKVAQFLRQVAFTEEMVNAWILQIGQHGRDPVVMAEEWIRDHPEIVKTWLAGIPH